MIRLILICVLLACSITPAIAGSTSGDDKVVLHARDDAASFVASEGPIRGFGEDQRREFPRHCAVRNRAVADQSKVGEQSKC